MAPSPASPVAFMPEPCNLLRHETSPYLLQHRDNPVFWRPWGADALAEARRDNKPILLSVGYAACHWCHVMAHESFEDPDIAAAMNRHFVNIKVDREERPDIDYLYQHAVHAMGLQGGWPLTMFLTPDGEPFWGGTYFPRQARYGMPGFGDVIDRVATVYAQNDPGIEKNKATLVAVLRELSQPSGHAELTPALLDQAAAKLVALIDPINGGTQGAPKFPQPPIFKFLWRAWRRGGDRRCRSAVLLTLERMCKGGIYDHLGGGFARYATDETWLVPHFEKMLYDNAQILELLTEAWLETGQDLFRRRVEETVGWLLREMRAEGGAFAASQDADSEGEEGKFYVWDAAEIDALLGEAAPEFKAAHDVARMGNWEHKTILNRLEDAGPADDPSREARLAASRAILFQARAKRVPPGWDDKVLADWNGLTIAALAPAAIVFRRPDWLAAAEAAFAAVVAQQADGERLKHSFRAGQAKHLGTLDDYAAMIRAALALQEATGKDSYLASARRWVGLLDRDFRHADAGGYYMTDAAAEDLITRPWHCTDNATPSGNSMMAEALGRLYAVTGEPAYRQRADEILAAFAGEIRRNLFAIPGLLSAFDFLSRPVQVAIIGRRGQPDTEALIQAAFSQSQPDRVLIVVEAAKALPAGHPAFGKTQSGGRATAYVCVGNACSLSIIDPETLAKSMPQPPAG